MTGTARRTALAGGVHFRSHTKWDLGDPMNRRKGVLVGSSACGTVCAIADASWVAVYDARTWTLSNAFRVGLNDYYTHRPIQSIAVNRSGDVSWVSLDHVGVRTQGRVYTLNVHQTAYKYPARNRESGWIVRDHFLDEEGTAWIFFQDDAGRGELAAFRAGKLKKVQAWRDRTISGEFSPGSQRFFLAQSKNARDEGILLYQLGIDRGKLRTECKVSIPEIRVRSPSFYLGADLLPNPRDPWMWKTKTLFDKDNSRALLCVKGGYTKCFDIDTKRGQLLMSHGLNGACDFLQTYAGGAVYFGKPEVLSSSHVEAKPLYASLGGFRLANSNVIEHPRPSQVSIWKVELQNGQWKSTSWGALDSEEDAEFACDQRVDARVGPQGEIVIVAAGKGACAFLPSTQQEE